jgi:hypothetical protein
MWLWSAGLIFIAKEISDKTTSDKIIIHERAVSNLLETAISPPKKKRRRQYLPKEVDVALSRVADIATIIPQQDCKSHKMSPS